MANIFICPPPSSGKRSLLQKSHCTFARRPTEESAMRLFPFFMAMMVVFNVAARLVQGLLGVATTPRFHLWRIGIEELINLRLR